MRELSLALSPYLPYSSFVRNRNLSVSIQDFLISILHYTLDGLSAPTSGLGYTRALSVNLV